MPFSSCQPVFRLCASLVCVFVLWGCEDTRHRISGTDIPGVHGLAIESSDVTWSDQYRGVESGTFELEGAIYDALERIRWSSRGFKKDGWTQVSITGTPDEATGVFRERWHDPGMERIATMHVVAGRTNGHAKLVIRVQKVAPSTDTESSDSKAADAAK